MPSQVVQPGWASQLVGVEAEAPGEQLELPVRLDLLDGVVGGVAVDDFQHRHLVVAATVAGYGLAADGAAVPPGGALPPAAQEAVRALAPADVLLSGVDVDQEIHALHGAQHLLPAVREGGDVVDRPDELAEPRETGFVLLGDLEDRLGPVTGSLDPGPSAGAPVDDDLVGVVAE